MDSSGNMQIQKVAVAMAVLRSKPAGMSGQEYAQRLCERFKASQLHWKLRCERAGTEILHLKQQLIIMQAGTQPADKEHLVANSEFLEDSMPSDSQPLFPTPPPSGSAGTSQTASTRPSWCAQFSLAKHTQFLHHVINIQTASKLLSTESSLQDITQQSLLHSLQLLQNHIGCADIAWSIQEHCIQSIVAIVDKSNKHLASCVLEKMSDMCSHVIKHILSHSQANSKALDHEVNLLSVFSNCSVFTPTLVHLLCDAILTYSNDLRKHVQDGESLDPNTFCNTYYLFKACDDCFTDCSSINMKEDEMMKARSKLEDSLLHLSQRFPLFAHAVWRLCAHLY